MDARQQAIKEIVAQYGPKEPVLIENPVITIGIAVIWCN